MSRVGWPRRSRASRPRRLSGQRARSRCARPADFVGTAWAIDTQVLGDLNGDRRDDLVLTLQAPATTTADDERQRALLILLRERDGQLRRAAFAEKLLQCPSCGGAFYGTAEAPAHVSISKGTVIVRQEHGSRNVVEQTFRFRFEPSSDRFWLIGLDLADRDRATGALVQQSTNYLTGQRTVTRSQFDQRTQRFERRSSTRTRVPKDRIPVEDVDYEAY